ncbi:MAG TPA: NAD(P)H-dependent oxidoreductase [Steroidobacteraceae bacterium]|nr:NAD(P)H-dependent oxidoreductase [Steroidobacteraceae bacterium]
MKVLHIDSSILGEGSASRALTREIVGRLREQHPDAEVRYLDLAAEALPHLSGKSLARSDETEAARNAAALEEFLAADVLVIGAPIYNFSIPSQLKAWIDRITVAGKTFRYTASGPEGLAGGKQVIVAMARGGVSGAPPQGEFGESYLKFLFAFLGIQDVRFVRAEGLALSPEHRAASLAAARAAIAAAAPVQALAA